MNAILYFSLLLFMLSDRETCNEPPQLEKEENKFPHSMKGYALWQVDAWYDQMKLFRNACILLMKMLNVLRFTISCGTSISASTSRLVNPFSSIKIISRNVVYCQIKD